MANRAMMLNGLETDDSEVQYENNMETDETILAETHEEYATLNAQLDQLNSVLDKIEMKNNEVHAAFVELLKSNREIRQQFQGTIKNDIISSGQSNSQ